MRFEIFQGKNGQWYWRLKARNNQIVAQSEGYTRKHGAWRSAVKVLDTIKGEICYVLEAER